MPRRSCAGSLRDGSRNPQIVVRGRAALGCGAQLLEMLQVALPGGMVHGRFLAHLSPDAAGENSLAQNQLGRAPLLQSVDVQRASRAEPSMLKVFPQQVRGYPAQFDDPRKQGCSGRNRGFVTLQATTPETSARRIRTGRPRGRAEVCDPRYPARPGPRRARYLRHCRPFHCHRTSAA